MKKLLSLILAILMIAALIVPVHADGTMPSRAGYSYLVGLIQENADYTEAQGSSYRLWRWKPELPSSEGKDVWLTFYYIDGDPDNGNLNVTLRTEDAVYYMSIMMGDWRRTWVDAADDPTLPDTFFCVEPGPEKWQTLQTRGGNNRAWISGQFQTTAYTELMGPTYELSSSFSDSYSEITASTLYTSAVEMIVWMVDALQYEAAPDYTLHDLYFYSAWNICRFHEWDDGTIYDPPTVSHAGHVKYQCMRCGKARVELVPKLQFTDVPEDAWYNDAVDWATENGVVAGTSGDTFSPTKQCTRAEIVTMLWRSSGSPEKETDNPFTDVPPTAYYAEAVAWAYENGITTGTGAATFSPNRPCTRAQIVTMLWRANGSPESNVQTRFADVNGSEWYAAAVRWAAENGITAGKRGDAFAAFDVCTRAEAVTFLWRADGGEE